MKTKNYYKELTKLFPKFEIKEKNGKFTVKSKQSNFKYYVDPENKVTMAILTDECKNPNYWLNVSYSNITKDINSNIFKTSMQYSDMIKGTYKGKSRCCSEDDFDIKTGISIARNKALAKYYKDSLNQTKVARLLLAEMEVKLAKDQLNFMELVDRYESKEY